jgi:hypothetical protein
MVVEIQTSVPSSGTIPVFWSGQFSFSDSPDFAVASAGHLSVSDSARGEEPSEGSESHCDSNFLRFQCKEGQAQTQSSHNRLRVCNVRGEPAVSVL